MYTIAAAGPDVAGSVGVNAIWETNVAVGEGAAVGERGVGGGDVVGVDCSWTGQVLTEFLGTGIGYV